MSFILDALRKSDAERQRAATPGLADVRYAARRTRRNIWLPLLVVVLVANVVFMGVQWFSRIDQRPAAAADGAKNTPAEVGQATAPPSPAAVPGPRDAIRPLARETEYGDPVPEPEVDREFAAPPEPEAGPPAVALNPTPRPDIEPEPKPAPVAPAAPSRILANKDMPTAEQLIGSGVLSMPMLNLDLHVYSDKAANRFVVINSRKYKEGGQLTEGPTVESITSDDVILAYQGQRFTLARR